jgi:hypothetical protein
VALAELSVGFLIWEGVSFLFDWDCDVNMGVEAEPSWLSPLSRGGVAVRLPPPKTVLPLTDRVNSPRGFIRREIDALCGVRTDEGVVVSADCCNHFSQSWMPESHEPTERAIFGGNPRSPSSDAVDSLELWSESTRGGFLRFVDRDVTGIVIN